MTSLFSQPWFGWALAVVIGLPVLLVILTEWHTALVRRGSALAKPVSLLRNYVLPAGALLILLTQVGDVSAQATPVRIIATVFGFVVLLMLLAALNAALFTNAERGTWRQRIPSIFVDIVRLVIIIAGLAVLFSFVWDADVAGLFTALGVTSIVLGPRLAERRRFGDLRSAAAVRAALPVGGLAADADCPGPGCRGQLAGRAHRHRQRHPDHAERGAGQRQLHQSEPAERGALGDDSPAPSGCRIGRTRCCALLARVAGDLPQVLIGTTPSVTVTGPKTYSTTVKVASPAEAGAVTATLQRWTWYAARRAGLHLDEADDNFADAELLASSVRSVAPTLRLTSSDIDDLIRLARIERYGAGEIIQHTGTVPQSMRLIIAGRANLNVATGRRQFPDRAQAEPGGVHRADGVDPGAGDGRRQCRRRADRPAGSGGGHRRSGAQQSRTGPGDRPGDRRAPATDRGGDAGRTELAATCLDGRHRAAGRSIGLITSLHFGGEPGQHVTTDNTPSLYEWAGGSSALRAMIDAFYDRVERDDLLGPLFPGGVSEEHRAHVAVWWSEVFGGPADYTSTLGWL